MKGKRIKLLLVIAVATTILMSANTATIVAENLSDEKCLQLENLKFHYKAMKPHINFYYQLLTEKYAPRYTKVWQDVIKDRQALTESLKKLKGSGKELGHLYDEMWLEEHSELQEKFLVAVEKKDDQALKAIIPQLIEHQKQLNTLLKKRLKEIK